MRHISRAIARGNPQGGRVPSLSSPAQTGGGMLNISRSRPSPDESRGNLPLSHKTEINIFALPTEERTWSLIQIYFEKTGQLLPFIHEASFCETYFRMREDNFRRVRRTWLGLLNIILAIATSLNTEGDLPAERRIQESDVYFQRANGLCDRDSKRSASLEMGTLPRSQLNQKKKKGKSLIPGQQSSIFWYWANISKGLRSQSKHGRPMVWQYLRLSSLVYTHRKLIDGLLLWRVRYAKERGTVVFYSIGIPFDPSSVA